MICMHYSQKTFKRVAFLIRRFNTIRHMIPIGSCVVFLVHGTILQQWASLLKNSASIEKRKNLVRETVEQSCQRLLNNHASDSRASDCWTILPVTVEQLCQRLLKNRASDCWTIVPVTVEASSQPLLKNRASHCWRVVPVTVEQSW